MEASFTSAGVLALLGLGLVFGLKHATEVDHVVAVSTIVSRHRNVLLSALVGALWGVGHTATLLLTGAVVLVLRVAMHRHTGIRRNYRLKNAVLAASIRVPDSPFAVPGQ